MKTKHIVILAVLAALLLAGRYVVRGREGKAVTTLAAAGLERLLPKDLTPADIRAIEVTGPPAAEGAAPAASSEASVPLRVERSGEGWIVTSAHGAPAEKALVDEFALRALALSGELRSEAASSHEAFGVDAAHATVLRLEAAEGHGPFILHLGKAGEAPESHFVRVEGSGEVRHVIKGLKSALGLWDEGAKPAADQWVDKRLLDLAAEAVSRVVVERPDGRLVLEKRVVAVPDVTADGDAAPPPAAAAWEVTAPSLPWPVNTASLAQVVERAVGVRASKALAPEACAARATSGSVTFTAEGGASHRIDIGGLAPLAGTDVIARAGEGTPCWSVSSWSLPSLLVRASSAWAVPAAFADPPAADAVKRVTVTQGGRTEHWTRNEDGTWKGDSGAKLVATSLPRVVSALLSLRLDDVADAALVPKAALATHATFVVEAGARKLVVALLGPRAGATSTERYVRIEGPGAAPAGFVGVLAGTAVDALLPAP